MEAATTTIPAPAVMAPAQDDERLGLGSASAAERDYNCPGNRSLAAICPPEPAGAIAEAGERIHKAWETGETDELAEDEATQAQRLRDITEDASEQFKSELVGIHGGDWTCSTAREERFWIRNTSNLQPMYSAKLDYAAVWSFDGKPQQALIIDGKTGFKAATPSEKNWQLRVQALALRFEYPTLTSIRVAIAHSRLRKFDATDYTADDLDMARLELERVFWRMKQPDAPRRPGTWCRYCAGKAYCREALSWALLETAGEGKLTPKTAAPFAEKLPIEGLAIVKRKSSTVTNLLDAVNARMKGLSADELASIGFSLEDGFPRKPISDALTLYDRVKHLVTRDQFLAALSVSKGGLTEALKPATGLKGEAFKAWWENLIKDITDTQPTDKVLKDLE